MMSRFLSLGYICHCVVESDLGYRRICEGLFLDNVVSGVYCSCDGSIGMSVHPDGSVSGDLSLHYIILPFIRFHI